MGQSGNGFLDGRLLGGIGHPSAEDSDSLSDRGDGSYVGLSVSSSGAERADLLLFVGRPDAGNVVPFFFLCLAMMYLLSVGFWASG